MGLFITFVRALDLIKTSISSFQDYLINFKPLISFVDSTSFIKLMKDQYFPSRAFPFQAYPFQAYPFQAIPFQAFPFRAYPYLLNFKMDFIEQFTHQSIEYYQCYSMFILNYHFIKVYCVPYEQQIHFQFYDHTICHHLT